MRSTSAPVLLTGERLDEVRGYLEAAAAAAGTATCVAARCGTVLVDGAGQVVGAGSNGLPQRREPVICQRKCRSASFTSDKTCCTHAEVRAIVTALGAGANLDGGTLVFTRVDQDGQRLHSGRPYCTICSKMALEVGLAWFVLEHADNLVIAYPTLTYNELSFAFSGDETVTDAWLHQILTT